MRLYDHKPKSAKLTPPVRSTDSGSPFFGQCPDVRSVLQLHRKTGSQDQDINNHDKTVPPVVHEVLQSPGQPIDSDTRSFFEERFAYDFSNVQVHTGKRASASAEAVNAEAYTVKNHVVFSEGTKPSCTGEDGHLFAHELVHVMQWGDRLVPSKLSIAPSDGPAERQAHTGSTGVLSSTTSLQRAVSVCQGWSRQDTGTGHPGPGIIVKVSVSGRRVDVSAKLQIFGPEADAAKAARIQNSIRNFWNRRFPDRFRITTNIRVTHRPPKKGEDRNATQVELIRSGHGTSSIVRHRHWLVGDRYMVLDLDDPTAQGWTVAHEFGHLLGLKDHYSEPLMNKLCQIFGCQRVGAVPDPGYENNIMGAVNGWVESRNVQTLIAKYAEYKCTKWGLESKL